MQLQQRYEEAKKTGAVSRNCGSGTAGCSYAGDGGASSRS